MPKIHLRHPGFTLQSSACRPLARIQNLDNKIHDNGDSRYICRNELDKACFQHDMHYENLPRRNVSDNLLCGKYSKLLVI